MNKNARFCSTKTKAGRRPGIFVKKVSFLEIQNFLVFLDVCGMHLFVVCIEFVICVCMCIGMVFIDSANDCY